MVCSDEESKKAEFDKIKRAMSANGYPKKFVEKAIQRQIKNSAAGKVNRTEDQSTLVSARIPFIDGLSQEIRRLASTAGIRCSFTSQSTLEDLYNCKDKLPSICTTHAVYSIMCETCQGEYVGETLRAVGVRRKEHQDAVRQGDTLKSAIAEHVHGCLQQHVIDWESMKVLDRATSQTERRIKEAVHIHKRRPEMNRDQGLDFSKIWNTVLY